MKVLFVNTSEQTGGAAIAAKRLMNALSQAGIQTRMLVADKQTDDERVVSVSAPGINKWLYFWNKWWERWLIFVLTLFNKKYLFRISIGNTGFDITRHPLVKEADVIHLHWINQGLLSLKGLKKLIETGKPIVWTMHDLWIADGIYHYPGNKPENKACFDRLDRWVRKQKEQIDLSRIVFVGCSRWMTTEAAKSSLLSNSRIVSIPNPIDTAVFSPQDKSEARKALGLPMDKKVLLFAAAKVSDERKGMPYFVEACRLLLPQGADEQQKPVIVLMGKMSEQDQSLFPFQVYSLGYLSSPAKMAQVYSAADVFVIPSLEDNLPNTIMEAMACGTPCVGFNTGGIPEMIDHLENGYVASCRDSHDLTKGINWALYSKERERISLNAREKVVQQYRESTVAPPYINLYHQLTGL